MEVLKIDKLESFNLDHIFECGQCFRWNKVNDLSYIGVIKDAVIQVTMENDKIVFEGEKISNKSFENIIYDYFDLNTNYEKYKEDLSNVDEYLKNSIDFGNGIRILNQDVWECIISFIISANNNIPRIKKIIERISLEYGKEIEFKGNKYYLFPTPEELSKAEIEDFRRMGAGFRDIRIYNTTKLITSKQIDLDKLVLLDNTSKMREELLKLDGVGPKVADCILLFSLKRRDVFPIDVWVRRVMNDLYIHNQDEKKINNKEILELAKDKFLGIEGIAQQYLFYWRREISKDA